MPYLRVLESRFDLQRTVQFMSERWHHSLYLSAVYLMLVFAGRTWMRQREPYRLRRALVTWNTGLAVFSIVGFAALIIPFIRSLAKDGLAGTVCENDAVIVPELALWGYLYTLSKPVELFDTFFIVLRKTPLTFLHWYHHCTVFVFGFYFFSTTAAVLPWFGLTNCFVHSIMYSYYACKALGWKIPSKIPVLITTLQLAQMFWGIFLNVLAFVQLKRGVKCGYYENVFYFAMAMYGSYALLFMWFFYQRYCIKKKKN